MSKSKITECLIDVELAASVRDMIQAAGLKAKNGNLGFRCPECKKPVKVVGQHFEHLSRNRDCSLSHISPSQPVG